MRTWFAAVFTLAGILQAESTPCEQLANLSLPHTSVTAATVIAASAFSAEAIYQSLPAFCRVQATLKPTDDSAIRIEVWLPESDWNGNLQSVGNEEWAGVIPHAAMAAALADGYAVAGTDGGHQGNEASFIAGHPEKLIDLAYRAIHEMTLAAKKIVLAHYGNGPKFSYWNGCGTGGRQGLAEVQRYPNDYDGVIAGAPLYDSSRIFGTQLWLWQSLHKEADFPQEKLTLLHDAVIKSCDHLDGVRDGVLEDPTRCGFEPLDLRCKNGDAPNCLTDAQAEAARQSYIGPAYAGSGYPAREWGSELGWLIHSGSQPNPFAVDLYKFAVFQDPQWDFRSFNYEKDVRTAIAVLKDTLDATNPNIGGFFDHGGKLIQYHGWADPGVPPQGSANYYRAVAQALGGVAAVDKSYRLFMIPGVGHCRGGEGTDRFHMINALEDWVQEGRAPDFIPASREVDGQTVRTRPLCPYPQIANYRNQGSTEEAPNFVCRIP